MSNVTTPSPEKMERLADLRDLRILSLIDAGLPLSFVAASEGVDPEHVRDLLRELPE